MMPHSSAPRGLIITADDFGLHESINEAVERAHHEGVLTAASLMVGAPAAADAVNRVRRMPRLRVGLHVVLADGPAVLPRGRIPDLVDSAGRFGDRMVRDGIRFFFLPHVRRQLKAEITAQFALFRTFGLTLDHVNAHRHFHLHPTVLSHILSIRNPLGVHAIRLPAEEDAPVFLRPWLAIMRRRLDRAGIAHNDRIVGLQHSGRMDEAALLAALRCLSRGVTEIYLHPATRCGITTSMDSYRHTDELAALLSPRVRAALEQLGIRRGGFADFWPARTILMRLSLSTTIAGLLGLAVMMGLIVHEGYDLILQTLAHGGWGLLWIIPFHMLPLMLDAESWWVLLRPRDPAGYATRPFLVWIAAVREAVSRLLPVASIGGELVGIRLAMQRPLNGAAVGASVIIEVLLTLINQYLFTAIGMVLLITTIQKTPVVDSLLWGMVVSLPVPILLTFLLRYCSPFTRIAGLIERMLGTRHRLASLLGHAGNLDEEIREPVPASQPAVDGSGLATRGHAYRVLRDLAHTRTFRPVDHGLECHHPGEPVAHHPSSGVLCSGCPGRAGSGADGDRQSDWPTRRRRHCIVVGQTLSRNRHGTTGSGLLAVGRNSPHSPDCGNRRVSLLIFQMANPYPPKRLIASCSESMRHQFPN